MSFYSPISFIVLSVLVLTWFGCESVYFVAAGEVGDPFLLCDINQKFSEGFGTVESYDISTANLGVVEDELIPNEGVGSSVYWWSDVERYRLSTGVAWDLCFTVFSVYQGSRDYIDYHNQLTLIAVKKGAIQLARYEKDDLSCRSIDNKGSAICKAAPGKETWTRIIKEGDMFVHNSSVPHSVAFITPYALRTVCFLKF